MLHHPGSVQWTKHRVQLLRPRFLSNRRPHLSCVGVVCFDERLVTMEVERNVGMQKGFDCEGHCLIDIDGDKIWNQKYVISIGLEFWGDVEGGIHPAENS